MQQIASLIVAFTPPSTLLQPVHAHSTLHVHYPVLDHVCSDRSIAHPARCRTLFARATDQTPLEEAQIAAIFKEFDTSGDGFIDLEELRAALQKAGRRVTQEEALDILKKVDINKDGQISLQEFRAVFQMEKVPSELAPLASSSNVFFDALFNAGEALGIEVRGQWRTTPFGSRFVDDKLGNGNLVVPGNMVTIHYTATLLSTGRVVETSRGGPPKSFELGEARPDRQNWDDALSGMRVGGQRRIYANPTEGDGPTARYDIEIVGAEEVTPPTSVEQAITALGGRRAALRLLFAATFIPYFLPERFQPAFFRSEPSPLAESNAELGLSRLDKADEGVAARLDALFAQEELPEGLRNNRK
mmetsp:Transcript_16841/g.27938  ORF Transcript_16841/g.27938 Transcript_16841/m.27938 type:complete len:359 (-) Transcript_16841:322-1398(-)|eukprot:CAMPEP_0119299918 /NCGR_PEP_ID=MMETSP1333-20130426/1939_1 /TAXON_ID=418940 /ORGANISM="Scyphosphaera apsteinii, Strain RCC1455" /LENGTH=358 /DNA_ID=CAMNT_0007301521 /DNA_START=8 /DNA_END=1084 /DNA_ORIENTATION=+